jgi:hypothetical protein
VLDPLAIEILEGRIREGSVATVDFSGEDFRSERCCRAKRWRKSPLH